MSPFKYNHTYKGDLNDLETGVARILDGTVNFPNELNSPNGCFCVTFYWDVNSSYQAFVSNNPANIYIRRKVHAGWLDWSKIHNFV